MHNESVIVLTSKQKLAAQQVEGQIAIDVSIIRIFMAQYVANYSSMSKLVETISKKPIPEHQKNVIFEITAEDSTEEDVEVPYVMVKLRKWAFHYYMHIHPPRQSHVMIHLLAYD